MSSFSAPSRGEREREKSGVEYDGQERERGENAMALKIEEIISSRTANDASHASDEIIAERKY